MKKTLSLLLALVMVFSLAEPACAAGLTTGDADLTVERPSVQPKDEIISDGEPNPAAEPEQPGEPAEDPAEDPVEIPDPSKLITEIGVPEGSRESVEDPFGAEDIVLEEPDTLCPENTFSFADEDGFAVEVFAPEGALPADAEMHVTRLTDLAPVQTVIDNAENLDGSVQLAADISFTLFGKEIEPAEGSKLVVRMSAPEIEGIAAPIVVHIPDGENSVPEIIEQVQSDDLLMADTVSFEASNFSVYVVLEPEQPGNEARLEVNFRLPDGEGEDGKGTIIKTVYIKNGDMYWDGTGTKPTGKSLINDIVYDPGLGENYVLGTNLFRGWTINAADANPQPEATEEDPNPDSIPYGADFNEKTKVYNIDEITEYLAGKLGHINEGNVLDIYAMIFQTYTISFFGTSTTVTMGQHIAYAPLAENATADYTINMGYTPDDNTHYFEGWKIMSGAENIVSAVDPDGHEIAKPYVIISEENPDAEPPVTATLFPNGTKLVVKGNVQFTVSAPEGNWLIFKENGKGATFNAPQFVKKGEKSFQPENAKPGRMIRNGYTFLGWYEILTAPDENGKAVPVLDNDGNYQFISDDQFVFDQYVTYETIIAAKWEARATAPYTVVIWEQSVKGGDKYDFVKAIPFTGNTGDTIDIITWDGAEVLYIDRNNNEIRTKNVKIDGEEYAHQGFHTGHYDTGKTVTAEGNTVVNVYYDRNNIQIRFYYVEKVYTEIAPSDVDTSSTGQTYLIPDGSGGYEEARLRRRNGVVQKYDGLFSGGWNTYSGKIYVDSGYGKVLNETFNGLYGATLKEPGYAGQSYTWPDTRWWYESYREYDETRWIFIIPITTHHIEGQGTRTTFLDSFLPTSDGTIIDVVGFEPESTDRNIIWYQQKADGTGYEEANRVRSNSGNFNLSDKYPGFKCVSWSANGTNYNNVGELMQSGDNWYYDAYPNQSGYQYASSSGNIYIRFDRLKYKISYQDGAYVDGNNNPVEGVSKLPHIGETEEITYGADISSYGQRYLADGTTPNPDYLIPTPNDSRFVFEGWYADETGTIPYDFETMPMDGVTVFAKWRLTQYRVFLRTNVPTSDTSLDWGDTEQSMNFRVNIGEYVSAPTGIRNDYNFVGWYYDADFNQVFDAERVPLSDDNTVDYDKTLTENMTDNERTWTNPKTGEVENYPIQRWGVLETNDPGVNKDKEKNRVWITRKLDLYAKWKAVLKGADGIGVVYDEVPAPAGAEDLHGYGQTGTAPTDGGRLYEDNSKAIAQSASKAASADEHFLYWVVQKWNGTAFEDVKTEDGKLVTAYPGDNFVVLAAYAKITPNPDDTSKNFYEVHLRAEYGSKDGPEPTHISFFANNGTDQVEKHIELGMNEAIDIPTPENYRDEVIDHSKIDTRDGNETTEPIGLHNNGCIFLGWAKLEKRSDGKVYSVKTGEVVTDTSELNDADLWLKWVEASGEGESAVAAHYEYNDNNAAQVAADEYTPYQDLYAVWQRTFFVYHTATGKVERVALTSAVNTVNLTELVDTSNYLYGGYYKAYSGASDTFKADPAELAWTQVASINAYGSNATINTLAQQGIVSTATDSGNGFKTYTAANINAAAFTWGDAYTTRGDQVIPINDVKKDEALVYYIKEVPIDNYLRPNLKFTYNQTTGQVATIWLVSGVDDGSYTEAGFFFNNKYYKYQEATDSLEGGFMDQIVFHPVNHIDNSNDITCTYNNQCGEYGITRGKLYYRYVFNLTSAGATVVGYINDGIADKQIGQYWVTPDGAYVTGKYTRAYTGVENKSTFQPVNYADNKGCVDVGTSISFTAPTYG